MALKEYKEKRDFKTTSEPEGKPEKSKKDLIFVVQRHAASRLHYDFRLEMDGVLKSWAVPKGPSLNPEDKRLAMMVEDHPYAYKDFEGTIPKGNYGAGEVEIWDSGTYTPINNGKISNDLLLQKELKEGSIKIVLNGKKLKGEFALVKMKNAENNAWLLIKHKDKYAESHYDAEENTDPESSVTAFLKEKKQKKKVNTEEKISYRSVLAGEKKIQNAIKPMLAKSAPSPFDDPDWLFEIKWDGYRAIAEKKDNKISFYSRNGISFVGKFVRILNDLERQANEMILDGEIVAYNSEGKPDFQMLQQIDLNPDMPLTYQVFDLLWLNGFPTKELPLQDRKELLKEALTETDIIKFCEHIPERGIDFLEEIKKLNLEGMIAKKRDSFYRENYRSSEWLKIKLTQIDEVIICGFTEPRGSRKNFGSLILAKYFEDELVYCGHTGTGFSDLKLEKIHELLQPLIIKNSPLNPKPKTNAPATWVQPKIVCEIEYSEITKDGIFRHPVFRRIREDKEAEEIHVKSKVMTAKKLTSKTSNKKRTRSKKEVKLTHPDKVYFPDSGITKADVVDYYQSIASYILPHLKNRPLSLNRFPNGIENPGFYQKNAGESLPDWMDTVEIYSESTEKYIEYAICNSKEALMYLNNLGCIDLNPWNSTTKNLDKPDFMVLDIDPSDKNDFEQVIEVSLKVKELLDELKTEAYCKTSGKTGMHIYLPLNKKYTFDQVKDFAHILMNKIHSQLPKFTTLERNLKKRGKSHIYLDYLQNRSGQTLASVYSLRPTKEASVSMPLRWGELKSGLKPWDFNIHNAISRIESEGDLFKPVLGKGIDMEKALKYLEEKV